MQRIAKAELSRLRKLLAHERELAKQGYSRIAGVDEAGRGPLAGPVVAAACIFPEAPRFNQLNDSKQLSSETRERLYQEIITHPEVSFGIGLIDVETIDRINILQATFLAMQKAVEAMGKPPDFLLIDGNQSPVFAIPLRTIIEGDAHSASIAAASILAKVTRDRLMEQLDAEWPFYGFKKHKGYATEEHLAAIGRWGPCPIHRKSFDPVKSLYYATQQISFF